MCSEFEPQQNLSRWKLKLFVILSTITSQVLSSDVTALIVIDVQNCFLPGGTLAVKDGDKIISTINDVRSKHKSQISVVVLTQDYHCLDHVSFASQYPGHSVYEEVTLKYLNSGELCETDITGRKRYTVNCSESETKVVKQHLWPDHCIINTTDALFHNDLHVHRNDLIIRKGHRCQVDSYSAFFDNGGFLQTELHYELLKRDVKSVYIAGLATDYCVKFSALDAVKLGYKTYLILDATRGVADETTRAAIEEMMNAGVILTNSTHLEETFPSKLIDSTFSTSFLIALVLSISIGLLIALFCRIL